MEQANGTPKARPHLKFANSIYSSSPGGNKRFGTPRPTMGSRRVLDRDALPSSTLNESSIDTARNIFRASSLSSSTGPRFEPSIPGNTLRKVFAPAATPEPKKTSRDSMTKATPRRTLAESTSTELFKMAIPEPPADLTGAELAKKVPEELNQQLGSVFADQYLEHLCPKDFNQLQRRQFFCILDLRRLKHAANEIFTKKDWKLNIMNFAKEFEKSRSLILLRYGLYEFRNVKPSAEVLRKWRQAHGLQDEEQEDSSATRTAKSPTKRKAEEEPDAGDEHAGRQATGKRRAVEESAAEGPAEATKSKRKASFGDTQPAKQQKTTPSATKTFLERIASKPATPGAETTESTPSKPAFAAKTSDSGLARSVMGKGAAGGNIFGYLSDASKNSGADGDAESETESDQEDESQKSNGAVNGAAAPAPSQGAGPTTNMFASKTSSVSGVGTTESNASSEGRESTPGRSLFDRVTKGADGQPIRLGQEDSQAEASMSSASVPSQAPASEGPANKTWTPGTPLKFAPQPSQGSSLFGGTSAPSSSIFQTTNQPTSSLFGTQKPAPPAEEKQQQQAVEADKSGESDKENASQPASSKLFPPSSSKPANGIPQTSTPSLFKPASADSESKPDTGKSATEVESQKPGDTASSSNIFGNKSQSGSLFGSSTPAGQSSTLFGNKPASAETAAAPAAAEAPKTTNLFGTPTSAAAQPSTEAPKATSNLFGNSGSTSTEAPKSGNLFGNAGSTSTEAPKSGNLFGNAGTASTEAPKSGGLFGNAGTAPTEAPKTGNLFGSTAQAATSNLFGGASSGGSLFGASQKPAPGTSNLFGSGSGTETPAKGSETPKAEAKATETSNSMFGSPMKQDGASPQKRGLDDAMQEDQPSPAKKPFGTTAPPVLFGGSQASSGSGSTSTPAFSFGNQQSTPSTSAPMFGQNTPSTTGINFNFGSSQPGSSSFGGPSSSAPFTFGASSQQPVSKSFTFGENNTSAAPPAAPTASSSQDVSNPFAFTGGSNTSSTTTPGGRKIKKPNFSASKARAARSGMSGSPAPPSFGGNQSATPAQPSGSSSNLFGGNQGGTLAQPFNFQAQPQGQQQNPFGANSGQPAGNLFGGASTTGTNSPFNTLGGASSLATTPATGTPEPGTDAEAAGSGATKPNGTTGGDDSGKTEDGDEGEPAQEQINLVEGGPGEEDETTVHDVRAKVLKYEPAEKGSEEAEKKKSPWSTKGVGPLRLLKHKTSGAVRVLLRREPTGQVALNRMVLPNMDYKPEEKYVKLMTSNESGTGLETWMIQVKTKDLAKSLADALEEHKGANKK